MESKQVFDKDIIEGNVLIAEFLGYVESKFNVYLHSRRGGFASGYRNRFVLKTQYDHLVKCFNSKDNLAIDKFYGDTIDNYKFDGEHLLLSAYNNRITPLDFLPKADYLQYHKSWDLLIPVITKIRESGYITVIKTKQSIPDIEATWKDIVDKIKYINQEQESFL